MQRHHDIEAFSRVDLWRVLDMDAQTGRAAPEVSRSGGVRPFLHFG